MATSLAILLPGCRSMPKVTSFCTYTEPYFGWSVDYPNDWYVYNTRAGITVSPSEENPACFIQFDASSQGQMSVDEICSAILGLKSTFKSFNPRDFITAQGIGIEFVFNDGDYSGIEKALFVTGVSNETFLFTLRYSTNFWPTPKIPEYVDYMIISFRTPSK